MGDPTPRATKSAVPAGDGEKAALRGSVLIQGLTKSFGDVPVLKGVDLQIDSGEFITILGPSGCGKSTLMRIIAGLEHQNGGSVAIDGVQVDYMRPSARDIAMVFQSYALYPHMTVFENMAVPLRMRKLTFLQRLPGARWISAETRATEREIAQAVQEVASTLHIEDLLRRKPGQLSGGQKQRVAVGRAMVREPRVFLMDEPLSNLDAELRVHMRAEIAQLHRKLGVTFIYVTHDQAEAMTMSDRVVILIGGKLLQVAAPGTIYHDPSDLAVARFVGSPRINVLTGLIRGDGIEVCGQIFALPTGLPDGTKVQIGIRPNLVETQPQGNMPRLSGRLVHCENLGSDFFLYLEVAGIPDRMIVRTFSDDIASREIGGEITVGLPLESALVFDEWGNRIRVTDTVGTARHRYA